MEPFCRKYYEKLMQSKILLKLSLVSTNIVGVVFFLLIFFIVFCLPVWIAETKSVASFESQIPDNLTVKKTAESIWSIPFSEQASLELPVRIKIPKININATFEYVGLTKDGSVDVPKNQNNVGWFNLGPRPGEIGSAIVTGHYGWKSRKRSVFDNLYKLRLGDKLYVQNYEGKVTTFVVRKIRRYGLKTNSSNVFVSNDGKAHLNLITCEGAWNKVSQSYPIRLVIFTDKQ